MDALTTAALDSLVKETLPKLTLKLNALAELPPEARTANEELAYLAREAQELLSLLNGWVASGVEAQAADPLADDAMVSTAMSEDISEDSMSDEDALALLAMEGASDIPDLQISGGKSVADSLSNERDDDNLSQTPEAVATTDKPMSDDEAMALLNAMDAPIEHSPSQDVATGDDMSDDEAMALLNAMDAPIEVPVVTSKTKPAAPKLAPAVLSADDEALALLKMMGGAEESEAQEPIIVAPAAKKTKINVVTREDASDEDEEDLQEIEEFAKNEFASDPDMMNDFLTNANDLIETLDQTILHLEQNPSDRETIESIFRAAHTLKGAAGMFGFKSMERVMHRMENLFDLVRKGTLIPNGDTIDVVFQGIDVLKSLISAVQAGKPSGTKTVPIVRCLELAAKGKYVKRKNGGLSPATASTAVSDAASGGDDGQRRGGGEAPKKKTSVEQSTIRVDLERLDMLVNLVGELVIDRTRFASIEEEIRTTQPQIKVSGNMTETVQLFGRHMNEIHEIIMKIRMVPIGNAFNKFTRIIRDISRQLGKDIELNIDGEDTELDKTLVEQIGDPLIHLIRNSCDHGIEMPDVRAANGKARGGKIFLSARQEGNHIIITIEDDGKGIPVDIIRKKAIERGLIQEDTVLSKRDVFNLIFEPGFSTAEKVTTISGRGVGMDVVRKQISKLKGAIDIDSEMGKGTTTTIRLPLTLAIVQSLLVECGGETFAIPLSSVVESVRIQKDEIQRVGETEVIKRHGKVLPLMHLQDTLELSTKADISWYSGYRRTSDEVDAPMTVARRRDRFYVVIVGSDDHRFGIVVDQLLNQQELVIKSMGPIMKDVPCVAGGAVLGNGEVVLVLDLQELEDRFRTRVRGKTA